MEEYATLMHETKHIVLVFGIFKRIQEKADKLHKKMCHERHGSGSECPHSNRFGAVTTIEM